MRRERDPAEIDNILSLFRLSHLQSKLPNALSGGEAHRVNVARAITWTNHGGLLLLDEPFAGMDTALRDDIVPALQAWLTQRDICVLSVTHDVAEAFQLGAEVIKIADGKVVAQGPAALVLADERQRLLHQLNP